MLNQIIKVSNIDKSFGQQKVLDNVSFVISEGDFVVLMGESGSGKSTLINILSLLDTNESGKYTLFGNDVTTLSITQRSQLRREKFNIIFQKYNLFEELTIYENLKMYLDLCELKCTDVENTILQITQSLGLSNHLHKKVFVLSQGEKQRVAIARSMLSKKEIIIADEPTASVDEVNRDIMIDLLKDQNKKGSTVIVATHDPKYLDFATKTLHISYGCINERKG